MSAETRTVTARHASWLASQPSSAAVEISSRQVAAVGIAEQGGGVVVSSHSAEPLPPGAVEPALNAINILDPAALTVALRTALDRLSPRPRRIALVLPDTIAKVSLVRFDKVPAKLPDLDQLIRWQVRKSVPFRIEDAQVAWIPGITLDGAGREFVVTVARKDVIAGYEQACDSAGAQAGVVDLASFNLMNTVLASMPSVVEDWLLVNVGVDYVTLAVVRGHDLVFFRNRDAAEPAELADLVHQTAMYHEDRLGGGRFARVVLSGAALQGAEQAAFIRRSLEERLEARVEALDFSSTVPIRDRITAGPELLDVLAPALGVLLRERVA